MSVIRNSPGNDASTVRQQEGDRDLRSRKPADKDSIQEFRQAMDQHGASARGSAGGEAREGTQAAQQARLHERHGDAAAGQGQDTGERGRGSADVLPPAESAAMWQAHQLAAQAPALATSAPQAAANPAALAQMLERHVRQFAVSEGGTLNGEGQVLLRLDDSTLPGTDLMLSRTADGWLLQADVRSSQSFDAIREAAGKLGERFSERGLGTLVVEPRYQA